MPELPEVETICNSLRPHLCGQTIINTQTTTPTLRIPINQQQLQQTCQNQKILTITRRAKYLIITLTNNNALIIHLGMTGSFNIKPKNTPLAKHDRIIWQLANNQSWRYNDIRKFGSVIPTTTQDLYSPTSPLAKLGLEPLTNQLNHKYLYNACQTHKTTIKNLIMNQHIIVGVGNIYANEALFASHIHPKHPTQTITPNQSKTLTKQIKQILKQAIQCGGSTISDYHNIDGSEGHFQQKLKIYGKANQPCLNCGEKHLIQRTTITGRASFHCNNCQK